MVISLILFVFVLVLVILLFVAIKVYSRRSLMSMLLSLRNPLVPQPHVRRRRVRVAESRNEFVVATDSPMDSDEDVRPMADFVEHGHVTLPHRESTGALSDD